jgi:hypothetical protein
MRRALMEHLRDLRQEREHGLHLTSARILERGLQRRCIVVHSAEHGDPSILRAIGDVIHPV